MSYAFNIYRVDLDGLKKLVESGDREAAIRGIKQLAEEWDWPDEPDFLVEAAEQVMSGNHAAPEAALVYFGLARQVDHELIADEWDIGAYEELADAAAALGLSDETCALLRQIVTGRTPFGEPAPWSEDDNLAAFLTADEGRRLADEILNSDELQASDDEAVTETVSDHLAPALDRNLPPGHGFLFIGL